MQGAKAAIPSCYPGVFAGSPESAYSKGVIPSRIWKHPAVLYLLSGQLAWRTAVGSSFGVSQAFNTNAMNVTATCPSMASHNVCLPAPHKYVNHGPKSPKQPSSP